MTRWSDRRRTTAAPRTPWRCCRAVPPRTRPKAARPPIQRGVPRPQGATCHIGAYEHTP
ncbi:choice-of-anchor Q domain-containing protein [Streptomyces sp. NPDC046832]|uniref:choice-of-anchor Q domain-containing protein n=1 Tax=Streptomyces sp. NPDC046832 TaxID=3155020 RepID=UPI0033D7FC64